MRLAQQYMHDRDLTTFVVVRPRLRAAVRGDRRQQGARRPRPAVARRRPATAARRRPRRSARPRPAGPAARCRSTSTSPAATRRRRRRAFKQVAGGRRGRRRSRKIKAAFLALKDPNDWTGDGQPEGWKVIDRAYTKAEARYIPNGANSTADMSHPTRTGDVVAFSYPPYQFDAATPGTLIARSAFFGQHGYVPDVQDLKSNTNMRATFLAGGAGDRARRGRRRAHASTSRRRRRSCSASRSRSRARASCGATSSTSGDRYTPVSIVGLNDFHGQLEQTTTTRSTGSTATVGGAAQLATMFDEEAERAARPDAAAGGG